MSASLKERLNDSLNISSEVLIGIRSQNGELFQISSELNAVILDMKGISQTYAAMKIRRVSLKTDLAELIALDVEFKGDAENDEGTGNDKDVEIADGDKNDEKAENGAP